MNQVVERDYRPRLIEEEQHYFRIGSVMKQKKKIFLFDSHQRNNWVNLYCLVRQFLSCKPYI